MTLETTLLVVGSERSEKGSECAAAGTDEKDRKLKKAEEMKREGAGAVRVLSEPQFCGLAGLPSPEALRQQLYALRDVLGMYPNVRDDHLRYLQKFGLIEPIVRNSAERYVRFADVATIRQASAELEQGAPFRAVLRALQANRAGQLTFNFRLDAEPAKILRLRRPEGQPARVAQADGAIVKAAPVSEAEELFQQGSLLDEGDPTLQDRAAAAYRKALEIDPYLVAALINLANIHYGRDELAEAQALYERAIGLEPSFFEAHFNLGNIYHDLGRYGEAASCYRHALTLNPQYADANFYLAVTLEKMGHSQEARPYWRAYQHLAPDGEWVDLAREFSE